LLCIKRWLFCLTHKIKHSVENIFIFTLHINFEGNIEHYEKK